MRHNAVTPRDTANCYRVRTDIKTLVFGDFPGLAKTKLQACPTLKKRCIFKACKLSQWNPGWRHRKSEIWCNLKPQMLLQKCQIKYFTLVQAWCASYNMQVIPGTRRLVVDPTRRGCWIAGNTISRTTTLEFHDFSRVFQDLCLFQDFPGLKSQHFNFRTFQGLYKTITKATAATNCTSITTTTTTTTSVLL